ncbi:MAG: bifunctional pyr operon transcriptional regulator/uracil phosphoribosyltransferase PyrR [Tepidisphaeraceae bacterium]
MQTHYDASEFARLLQTLCDQIAAFVSIDQPFNVVGIRTRGETLVERIVPMLRQRGAKEIGVGALDITLYRDDLSELGPKAIVRPTLLQFDIDRRPLILVDDVLFTGRTVRAALNALADFGRPSVVRLAVLVDRGGRELPIKADAVALKMELPLQQQVKVKVTPRDGSDGIDIEPRT